MKLGWLPDTGSIIGFTILGIGGFSVFFYCFLTGFLAPILIVRLVSLILGIFNLVFQYANFGGRLFK